MKVGFLSYKLYNYNTYNIKNAFLSHICILLSMHVNLSHVFTCIVLYGSIRHSDLLFCFISFKIIPYLFSYLFISLSLNICIYVYMLPFPTGRIWHYQQYQHICFIFLYSDLLNIHVHLCTGLWFKACNKCDVCAINMAHCVSDKYTRFNMNTMSWIRLTWVLMR